MPDGSAIEDSESGHKHEKFITSIDTDDPEYKRNLLRPASIKEDVILMSQKQRVSLMLSSDAFRRELEEVVRSHSLCGDCPGVNTSLLSLQHASDLFSSATAGGGKPGISAVKGQHNGIIPINDLRGGDAMGYSRRERSLRCKLAAVYRLLDLFGWSTSICNHATARISSKNEHFLVNPFGLLYHEVTASSLLKVDCKGNVIDPGSTVLGLNQSTWMLHAAVHSARADIRCIIHIDTPATIAVSCMKSGLYPLCHEAMIIGETAYYTPTNLLIGNGDMNADDDRLKDWTAERAAIAEALGATARVLFLRSRGLLALGETVEEAWHYASNAIVACETQLLLASLGMENLVLPTDKLRQKTYEAWRTADLGGLSGPEALAMRLAAVNRSSATEGGYSSGAEGHPVSNGGDSYQISTKPWRLGELEFEAMMRHLDNSGCRTGHLYRQESWNPDKSDWETTATPRRTRRTKSPDGHQGFSSQEDIVKIPPTASSVTATMSYYYDDGMFSGDETEGLRPSTLGRDWPQRTWLNTPNKYTKQLVKPSPSHEPVAHWVSEKENAIRRAVSSGALPPPAPFHPLTPGALPQGTVGRPSTGTTLVGASFNTFAPQGTNPREYRDQQRKVKAKYYHDTNTAGPQSRLLDGLTWDEARRVRDEGLMKVLGPKVAALVTQGVSDLPVAAASKAIIQRDVRDAAVIYDGLYSHQNPFEKITDEELEMYRREIELKNNPDIAAELERRGLIDVSQPVSPFTPDAIPVDSGATDLESASDTGPVHLAPPPATSTLTSELSGPEEHAESERKKKKKRFKLPSFSLSRTKDKSKGK